MPAQIACPISGVDRALASYINSREETLRIRRTLTKYVTSSLRPVTAATQTQHLNQECPNSNITAVSTNPPGLRDLRLQYLQALRAHNQAQTRHGQILDTLSDLHQQYMDENPTQPQQSDHDNDTARSYITLLRQRRRLAELQVIQDSLEKLLNAKPPTTGKDPKILVEDSIGEQPDLPIERLEQITQANNDQTWVFKLKQEVLDARASMEQANTARMKAQEEAPKQPSLQQQVYALECARHEIVEWVQGELSKLEEDSIFLEDVSPIKKAVPQTETVDLQQAEQRIREAYDRYTQSRANLIESYEMLQQPPQASTGEEDKRNQNEATSDQPKDDGKLSMPITKILPHLPHLTRTANYERSLLQQSVYLQSQIASADQEIEEALLRLSGESHLLPAGSKDVAAWGKAAAEAEHATREFVKEHLESSRQETSSVSTIVELCSLQSKVLASS